jgi:hypothetical protein
VQTCIYASQYQSCQQNEVINTQLSTFVDTLYNLFTGLVAQVVWRVKWNATRNSGMEAAADNIVVSPEDLSPRDSSARKSDRPRRLTAKGIENLSGNLGVVMQALVRETRDETMKQMAKAQEESVKEITSSYKRITETLWDAWKKEQ